MTLSSPKLDLATVQMLEELAFNAWPALQTALVNGWIFRWADGYTKRANSANALAPVGAFEATLKEAKAFYTRHNLPVIFRLSPLSGAEPDIVLAQAGYRRIDETSVLVADLGAGILSKLTENRSTSQSTITLTPTVNSMWCEGYAKANGVPVVLRDTHHRMLAGLRFPAGFATVYVGSTAVAYGLAVVERGMVGLFDIVVLPDARRQGYGLKLVHALLEWGQAQGADAAYLQVVTSNQPAIALYERLGFSEAYRYHYRLM